MSSRMILLVVAGAVLTLTLFFAAAAGAQETTTAQTAAPQSTSTSTASANSETVTADNNANRSNSDNFRCESVFREIRDDRGAQRRQYNDELVVQRFEQCLSGDVLRNTIPNRNLPFTGGMPLIGLAAIGLVLAIAGIAALRAVIRRAG